jgi:recombinational DNA repair protein (RecF pathway)
MNNLNCVSCSQNVMISGLKVYNKEWHCRTCIKEKGLSLQTSNAILQYDFLEQKLNKRDEYLQNALKLPKNIELLKSKKAHKI